MLEVVFIIFIGAACIQAIYWLLFAGFIIRHKQPDLEGASLPGISIIVCAYNELENLKKLLPALYSQNHPDFEIVVVNDRSTDGTYEYLLEQSEQNKKLKLVHIERTPAHVNAKKYALTLGIKVAKHEQLVFTDADCQPATGEWASNVAGSFNAQNQFVLGYSQFKAEQGFVNSFSRFETQMTGMLCHSFALAGNPYMGVGRNLGYTKSMFLQNNGFGQFQQVVGGDDDLFVNQYASKANTEVCLGLDALVWSYSKNTVRDYFKQKLRHISVSRYYKSKDKLLLGMYSASHLLFWIAFVILAASMYFPEIVFGVLIIRMVLNSLIINSISKKFGERIVTWTVPMMDFIYSVYLLIMGFAALSTKKVRWN